VQIPLYEHPIWESVPNQVMRPGGLTLTERAFSLVELAPGSRVLDLGCGLGATLQHLSAEYGLAAFGVDISSRLVGRVGGAAFAQARSEQLPLVEGCMEAVISECTLSLFDAEAALREVVRVLRPGGWFIVSDLYARNPDGIAALRSLPAGTGIGAAMARDEIEAKIAACGLEITAWQDCSERLKEFPVCTLSTAAIVDPFDLILAAGKAKLGYYLLVARRKGDPSRHKQCHGRQ
jgi:arsenite methyltransferase